MSQTLCGGCRANLHIEECICKNKMYPPKIKINKQINCFSCNGVGTVKPINNILTCLRCGIRQNSTLK